MNGSQWKLEIPIENSISKIQFAPHSNNLLISSWDTCLRLYDFDASVLRFESPSEFALLDCCFTDDDSVAFTAASDGFIRRYDLHSGIVDEMGNHDDVATCIGYSNETCLLITSGFDNKLLSWDVRTKKAFSLSRSLDAEIDSMSVSGFKVTVGTGASAHIFDLRNFDKSSLSMEPCNITQIKCVSSIPYAEGFAVGSVDGRVALQVSNSSNLNDIGYTFRCHPKSKDGQHHFASVKDIAFNPLVSGVFVTGDDAGYATIWDARSRKRLIEFPKYSNSVASLSYNHLGQLLAIASSYTHREAKQIVEPPQVFIQKVDNIDFGSSSGSSSARRKT